MGEHKVGDPVWLYRPAMWNTKDPWRRHEVIAVTSRSYVVREYGRDVKIPKRDADTSPNVAWSEAEVAIADARRVVLNFGRTESYKIGAKAESFAARSSPENVLRLCELIGYDVTDLRAAMAKASWEVTRD